MLPHFYKLHHEIKAPVDSSYDCLVGKHQRSGTPCGPLEAGEEHTKDEGIHQDTADHLEVDEHVYRHALVEVEAVGILSRVRITKKEWKRVETKNKM